MRFRRSKVEADVGRYFIKVGRSRNRHYDDIIFCIHSLQHGDDDSREAAGNDSIGGCVE